MMLSARPSCQQGHSLALIRPGNTCEQSHCLALIRPDDTCEQSHCLALIQPDDRYQQGHRVAIVRLTRQDMSARPLSCYHPTRCDGVSKTIVSNTSSRPRPTRQNVSAVHHLVIIRPGKMCPQYIILSSSDQVKCVSKVVILSSSDQTARVRKAIILSSSDQIRWYQKDHRINNTPSCHHPGQAKCVSKAIILSSSDQATGVRNAHSGRDRQLLSDCLQLVQKLLELRGGHVADQVFPPYVAYLPPVAASPFPLLRDCRCSLRLRLSYIAFTLWLLP